MWTQAIRRSRRWTTWRSARLPLFKGQVYNPELGFALVGNVGAGDKYPYNPFYGSFSPRIAAAWNPHFDGDGLLSHDLRP